MNSQTPLINSFFTNLLKAASEVSVGMFSLITLFHITGNFTTRLPYYSCMNSQIPLINSFFTNLLKAASGVSVGMFSLITLFHITSNFTTRLPYYSCVNSQTPLINSFFTNLLKAASEVSVGMFSLITLFHSIDPWYFRQFLPSFLNHRNMQLMKLSCIISMNVSIITKHHLLKLVGYHIVINMKHE